MDLHDNGTVVGDFKPSISEFARPFWMVGSLFEQPWTRYKSFLCIVIVGFSGVGRAGYARLQKGVLGTVRVQNLLSYGSHRKERPWWDSWDLLYEYCESCISDFQSVHLASHYLFFVFLFFDSAVVELYFTSYLRKMGMMWEYLLTSENNGSLCQ